MDISINSDLHHSSNIAIDNAKVDKLKEQIGKDDASDEELKEVCKSFEAYMLEQVFKQAMETVTNDDDKNPYLQQFGDILYTEYAKSATEQESIGIAQMLYEAMKRNE